jgi:ATP-binding cassette subfamily B protein
LTTEKNINEFEFRNKTPLGTLKSIYSTEKKNLIISSSLLLIKHSPALLLPVITGNVINLIIEGGPGTINKIILNAVIISILIFQNIITHTLFIKYLSKANRSIEKRLRFSLVKRMQELSISFHDNFESGRLQTKVLRDVESIEILTRQLANIVFIGMLNIVFVIVATLFHNIYVALFYIIIIPLSVFLVITFRRKMVRGNEEYRSHLELMSARVSEMVQMIPITRAHGAEKTEITQVNTYLEKVQEKGFRLDVINAIFGSSAWVSFQMFQFICLLVTGFMAYYKLITVGDVVMYQGFFGLIINAINMIINVYPEINRGFDSIRSLGEILECPDLEQNEGKQKICDVKGDVEFRNVSFGYVKENFAVNDVSFKAEAGETIAFVGESGAGKSTLMNLLIGYRRPSSGEILLDGKLMSDIDLRTYRRHIAVVPQNIILFSGSIKENILYGIDDSKIDEVKFQEVLQMSRVSEFAGRLPQGADTRIGEHGSKLSGGQRQRIAIARALIRDPEIIIFDEATSALDVQSETLIREAIDNMIKNRTTFIIAHRLSTVRNADKIIVMHEGRILEYGNHDFLMDQKGKYFRMNIANG